MAASNSRHPPLLGWLSQCLICVCYCQAVSTCPVEKFKDRAVLFYWPKRRKIVPLAMIEAFLVAVLLLLLALLFLAHRRWECSSFVKTIDLIPGPKRKPIVGNATALPRESDRRLFKFFSVFYDITANNAPPFSHQIWDHYIYINGISKGHHKSIFLRLFDFMDSACLINKLLYGNNFSFRRLTRRDYANYPREMGKTIWSHLPHMARISDVCAYFDANVHGGKNVYFYSYNNFNFWRYLACWLLCIFNKMKLCLENVNEPDVHRQRQIL